MSIRSVCTDDIQMLVGQKVLSIEVDSGDQHCLRLTTDKGITIFETEGDCCSETWFADIIGVDQLIDRTILSALLVDMDVPDRIDSRSRQESDQFYCLKLTTEWGVADIIFRNSSNGYYGGNLNIIDELPGGIEMIKIVSDYTA
jgi:hypothetical protein